MLKQKYIYICGRMQGGTAMHIHVFTNIHPNYRLTDFQFVCTVVFL